MIKFSAIGDVALFGDYTDLIGNNGYDYPFACISKYINKSDVVFANLEAPLSNEGRPDKSKPISICGSPSGIASLIHTGISDVSLANNHSYDYGKKAILDTQRRLKEAGISFVGIGKSLNLSRQPIIKKFQGGTLAILAYNSYSTNGRYYASRIRGGVSPLEYKFIKHDIRSIKQKYADCIILISLHWGIEGSDYPTPFQRDLAHQIIKDGADLIIGHHPHVIQGVEQYGKGIIVYSLGNFCFPNVSSPHIDGIGFKQKRVNKESFIFQCDLTNEGIEKHKIVPIILNDHLQPEIATGAMKSKIIKQIKSLSEPLHSVNYKINYFAYKTNNRNSGSKIIKLIDRLGFSGIIKRLNIMYIRAYLITIKNILSEALHKRSFYNSKDKL